METTALILRLSEDSQQLLALVEAGTNRPPLDAVGVRTQLAAQDLSSLYLDEHALALLLTDYAESPERFERVIGERRNGVCRVDVADDKSSASVTLIAPCGGAPVTAGQIDEALKAAGVVAGILPDEIEAALAGGSGMGRVVARGRQAVDGTDAAFVSLLPEPEARQPRADEYGVIDFREFGQIASVGAGAPLMRRIPSTAGEPGYDVRGKVFTPRPGRNTPFSHLIKGAKVDPADANLLCASISGRPIVTPTGIVVDPVVVLPDVDIASGNVDFDGSVSVKGEVSSGMRIRATGDVFIGGSVAAGAAITAGGKVVVTGGVIGGGAAGSSDGEAAVIRCQGVFQARFLEYAHIESGADIVISDYCMHSRLAAGARVLVGAPGSKSGHIRGGTVTAGALVKAVSFSSPTGVKTVIRVGVVTQQRTRLLAVEKDILAHETREADLRKAVAGRHSGTDDQALAQAVEQLDRLREELTQLKACLALAAEARVVADRNVYSGTEIHIGGRAWSSHDDLGSGVFRLKEGAIVFGA